MNHILRACVRNSRVLKGPSLRTDLDFDRQVERAEASGAISEDESDKLLLLDLIVSGTRTGARERVYAGIEVSITANDDDVNRAADRAEILGKVSGGPVMAARVEAPQRELAAQRGDTLLVVTTWWPPLGRYSRRSTPRSACGSYTLVFNVNYFCRSRQLFLPVHLLS